ncbi:GNAT family N-acetyltransferase [Paludibacterium purpuratum]|uniref:Acetyltransferase (GNAT) family protein n=1 Tax=Paludibacterium purpuratum TaxID=1144873 RepID=A0A4R7AWZ5_9NEIS|nr:GNAT family N-acetyltransferase [Paludibacterium purpuratum]TDR72054.1 acetyltransferase (GNAT) family protein [Paludibacterium purpuratum]
MARDNPPSDRRGARAILYRPWQAGDSPQVLTDLLHRAFADLARCGIHCASGNQPSSETLARIARGWSFVAVDAGRIVGTITVYPCEQGSGSRVYRDGRVASVHQFAVDPGYQGQGVGDALLRLAECAAKQAGFSILALDTPKRADKLRAFYLHMGFRIAESMRFKGRRYISLVLEKPLFSTASILPATAWL